ncbi:hypothetical protein GCM10009584_05400 [Ornithinimicrobium humiphilum]
MFAVALGATAPAVALLELALRPLMQSLHYRPAFRVFLGLRLVAMGIFLSGCVAAGLLLEGPWRRVLVSVALMKVADSVLDIYTARALVECRINLAAGSAWINALLSSAGSLTVIALGYPAELAVIASAATSLVVAVYMATRGSVDALQHDKQGQVRAARTLVMHGFPLAAAQAVVSLVAYAPVLILSANDHLEAAGIYATVQYFVTFANLYFMASQQAVLGKVRHRVLAAISSGATPNFMPYWLTMLAPALAAFPVLGISLQPLVALIYGPSFDTGALVPWIVACTIVGLAIENCIILALLAMNRYSTQWISAVACLPAMALVAICLVPINALVGASAMTAAAILTRCLVLVAILIPNLRENEKRVS